MLGMRHWPLRAPTPLQSTLWPIIDPTLVTQFGHANVIFAIPTQPLSIYVSPYQSFKWVSLLTVNMKPSYSKNRKMCEPILVTLWKMQPHYSQSSRENATPSSVAYQPLTRKYPPPPTGISLSYQNFFLARCNAKSRSFFLWVVMLNLTIFWDCENSIFLFRTPKSCQYQKTNYSLSCLQAAL